MDASSNQKDNKNKFKGTNITIPQFFNGRSVFLTGGTGFMGKVLVEKLLRCCTDINYIYILMRPKHGEQPAARLQKLISGSAFSKLNPELLSKIVPVHGDISLHNLGISESDRNILIENVSVVFHLAATVKFDDTLKDSVTINVLGTQQLVELCHYMTKLEALIHVSTAFSNCDRFEVNEMIYPPPFSPEQVVQCVEWMDDGLLQVVTPKLLGKHPNTYTFTKSLAEHVILKKRDNLPVAIVRPSIVLSSHSSPEPGWVDNWNGPNKFVAAAGSGLLRSALVRGEKLANLIPVDVVINLLICAAWHTALSQPDTITIYNCCSGQLNPIRWNMFISESMNSLYRYPTTNMMLRPKVTCFRMRLAKEIYDLFFRGIPALLVDSLMFVIGRTSKNLKMHKKLCREMHILEYFTTNEWQFTDFNARSLNLLLNHSDRAMFSFDVTQINWRTYLTNYVLGIRQFLLKENLNSVPEARKKLYRLLWVEALIKFLLTCLVCSVPLYVFLQKNRKWHNFVLNFALLGVRVVKEN